MGAIALGGCTPYVAKPASITMRVEHKSGDPGSNHLRVAASELKHPYIRPVDLDLNRGVSPEEAGVLAVLINPEFAGRRDQRALRRRSCCKRVCCQTRIGCIVDFARRVLGRKSLSRTASARAGYHVA